MEKTVWNRTYGRADVSDSTFNAIFALTTILGMGIYAFAATLSETPLGLWSFLLIFGISLLGTFVTAGDFIPLKLVGLTMISGGLGYISGPYIHQYKFDSIMEVVLMTVIVTAIFGAAGMIYPKSLENWGSTIFISLIALIVAQVLCGIFLGRAAQTWMDWIGVILFCGILVFDFNRAQRVSRTASNAMDCGIHVFLDIANIFIRLLSLFGVKTKSDD